MNIIVAPDSFKDCMSAAEVCSAVEEGIFKVDKNAVVCKMPLADGGEGTAKALTEAAGGRFVKVSVSDPLGRKIDAVFGLIDGEKTAVIDMASASGLELLSPGERNPLKTSSRGTGELILSALDYGAENILIGLGGSATNDGGIGMLNALGFRFLDENGNDAGEGGSALAGIVCMDSNGADSRIKKISIRTACDVKNPLTGPNGASTVFGPQKGASLEMVKTLEKGLANLGQVWIKAGLTESTDQEGDGAAGGTGAALRICLGAKMESGALLIMTHAGFFDALKKTDLVITGEGRTDSQTLEGKLCSVVAGECKKAGVPIVLLSGAVEGEAEKLFSIFDYAVSVSCGETSLEAMIQNSRKNLSLAAENIIRAIMIGRKHTSA